MQSMTMAPPGLSIAAALKRCATGDRAALRVIYDAEAPAMIGVAMRILKRRELAEEAVHDAFMRIFQYAASFDPARGEAKAWIYAILRHRALNILRGEARTELVDDNEKLDAVSEEETPEAAVARLSDEKSLKRCLETLEPVRRNAVVLAFVQGLTHGEVAGRLGVPLGTCKAWIRRSLLSLRECMG
jgi:RNA polymerase sigma-70 factor (ECF subfamily)